VDGISHGQHPTANHTLKNWRHTKASSRGAISPERRPHADHAPWSVLLFPDPLPSCGAVNVLRFQRQGFANVARREDAAAGSQNVAGWTRNAVVDGLLGHYAETKSSMLRTFAFEEYHGMEPKLRSSIPSEEKSFCAPWRRIWDHTEENLLE
jgi:hypothetical protein